MTQEQQPFKPQSRDPETGDVQFFGLVDGLELELG